ncbi:DUF5808 domain-containing protein [Paenibacillus arenilitoris]|uniref:DUF5808 domain-containing protein n=1 Tax=Paenibacillus arenilitoris TaxID=2772299 RepID=A0A927HA64_9BACL|nr:DUF5808 domain-containing protein [Paenibacillus arenilitoris]MBD2872314.1 hypothetical protein [Paenibacillus arenilitoris]
MDAIYFIVPALLAYICIMVMFIRQATPRNRLLFGVTLPSDALLDPSIAKLRTEYKKTYAWYGVVSLLAIAPFFALADYFSMALIYMFIWFAAFIYTSKLPFNRIHRQAAALKREKDWFVGEKRLVQMDAKLRHHKQAKALSPYWFLIPALMSVTLIVASFTNANVLLKMTGFASLAMTAVLFAISHAFRQLDSKIYGGNPDVNAAINRASRRYWSILWLGMAIFESLNAMVAYAILNSGSASDFTLWLIGGVMVSLVPLGAVFFVHNKVRALEESLAASDGQGMIADDDAYWINGSTYYNPDDQSVMVPKRVGIGTTFNMATRAGKWFRYGSVVLAFAIILPLAAFAVQSDHTAPVLHIGKSGIVAIDYPLHDYSFEIGEVRELSLVDSIPSGFRTNGTATAEYARGSFNLEKLGNAKLYVFKKSPPYILAKLDGQYVIFNDKNAVNTKAIFDELKALRDAPEPSA